MKHQKISVKVTDIILTLALIVMLASGIMMHPSGNILIIKILHKISSLLFVIGIIIHVISHRKRMRIAVL